MDWVLIILIAALICFLAAAFGVSSRVGLTPFGLALVVLAMIVGQS